MINYCTFIDIPKSAFAIGYRDRLMFSGSCFAEQIGARMREHGWDTLVNPFGVLYNPSSIALGIRRLLKPEPFVEKEVVEYDGMAHSFMHHGQFSDPSVDVALAKMNNSLTEASSYLPRLSCLVITFGTAYVYVLKSDGRTVANCHKLPASLFERELLTVERIVDEWSDLLDQLFSFNASLKVIFTVSPIRHWKDGAHANQISKSVLLLAEQALMETFADRLSYFPAYELMMDELRDYRFYADDLLHPSTVAIDYIWERFCDAYMDSDTKEVLKVMEDINRDLLHRPFHASSEANQHFLKKIAEKISDLKHRNPYLCTSKQEREIEERLQASL